MSINNWLVIAIGIALAGAGVLTRKTSGKINYLYIAFGLVIVLMGLTDFTIKF